MSVFVCFGKFNVLLSYLLVYIEDRSFLHLHLYKGIPNSLVGCCCILCSRDQLEYISINFVKAANLIEKVKESDKKIIRINLPITGMKIQAIQLMNAA